METIDKTMAAEFAAEETPPQQGHGPGGDDAPAGHREEEAMPQLPEGIGLNYEDVRKLLAMKHEIMLGKDEPILMMVTLCNVFLGELEKIHNKHNEAVTKIMVAQTDKYIKGVKATTDALGQTLAENSVEGIRAIFHTHAKDLAANKTNSRWCAAVIAVSALANIAVMALSVWR